MVTRSLSLIVTVAAAVGLAACGESNPPSPAPSTPTTQVAVKDAVTTEAQKLIDQATQAIKDNKLDVAEKAVAQLESMKPKLSAEWQGRVDQARSALESAKKAAGALKNVEVPKIPG